MVSEYEYILRQGNVPLKNNLIRRIVRNVLGVFRSLLPDIMKEVYDGELAEIARENSLEELFCRSMEEFLISGMVVHRHRLRCRNGKGRIETENVSPDCFFFNTDARDVRGRDVNMAGQIHKVGFNDWCKAFVKDRRDYQKARKLFDNGAKSVTVTEVWRKEPVARYLIHDRARGYVVRVNEDEATGKWIAGRRKKWILDEVWRYYFLSEDGSVLLSGDSPYRDGSHPYVFKCYPFLEGEIHSFVGDMIDQQRYTNRLITLYDWVIRASAKGVLLLPEGSVDPENYRAVADQWSRFNGVIVYKSDLSRAEPKQVSGNMSNLGISELLEIQLKMLEDVSGVNGILQGNTTSWNVSGELYKHQTTNSMYSLADLMETYKGFIAENARKFLENSELRIEN